MSDCSTPPLKIPPLPHKKGGGNSFILFYFFFYFSILFFFFILEYIEGEGRGERGGIVIIEQSVGLL